MTIQKFIHKTLDLKIITNHYDKNIQHYNEHLNVIRNFEDQFKILLENFFEENNPNIENSFFQECSLKEKEYVENQILKINPRTLNNKINIGFNGNFYKLSTIDVFKYNFYLNNRFLIETIETQDTEIAINIFPINSKIHFICNQKRRKNEENIHQKTDHLFKINLYPEYKDINSLIYVLQHSLNIKFIQYGQRNERFFDCILKKIYANILFDNYQVFDTLKTEIDYLKKIITHEIKENYLDEKEFEKICNLLKY